MRVPIAVFTAVAAAFIAIAANQALEQQQKLQDAVATPATVTDSKVDVDDSTDPKGRRKTTYKPVVRYRFTLGGMILTSTRVFPLATNTSHERAKQIVAEFPPGKIVTAWYDPKNPGDSFLLREWDFGPYLTILFCMIPLSAGLGLWLARPWRRTRVFPPKPARQGNWHELEIRTPLRARRHPWRAITLVWFVLGGVAVGHYFAKAGPPYSREAYVATPIYFALGLIPLAIYLRHLRAARTAADAKIFANTTTFRRGRTFDVRVEQSYKKPTTLSVFRVGLICESTTHVQRKNKSGLRTAPVFETWNDLATDQQVTPAHPFEAKTKLTPPADQPATTPQGTPPPGHRWRIAVEAQIIGRPPYRADFPIVVEE